jgi:hypothetical protein
MSIDESGRVMRPGEKFSRAADQAAAAREMFDECFCDEDETYWMVAEGRTADEAVALISNIEPEAERPQAKLVRGVLGTRHGESWFTKQPDGPVAMWEVAP